MVGRRLIMLISLLALLLLFPCAVSGIGATFAITGQIQQAGDLYAVASLLFGGDMVVLLLASVLWTRRSRRHQISNRWLQIGRLTLWIVVGTAAVLWLVQGIWGLSHLSEPLDSFWLIQVGALLVPLLVILPATLVVIGGVLDRRARQRIDV